MQELNTQERDVWAKEVKKELIEREMSMTDLADAIHYSPGMIYAVLSGAKESTRVRALIDDYLSLTKAAGA